MKVLNQPARLRLENARGIDKNNLAFRSMNYAVVGVARGLRLRRDDGDLGSNQRVQERRLADIGAPDKHGQPGFEVWICWLFHCAHPTMNTREEYEVFTLNHGRCAYHKAWIP